MKKYLVSQPEIVLAPSLPSFEDLGQPGNDTRAFLDGQVFGGTDFTEDNGFHDGGQPTLDLLPKQSLSSGVLAVILLLLLNPAQNSLDKGVGAVANFQVDDAIELLERAKGLIFTRIMSDSTSSWELRTPTTANATEP